MSLDYKFIFLCLGPIVLGLICSVFSALSLRCGTLVSSLTLAGFAYHLLQLSGN